jgi:serine/threonine protein kinase
MSSVTEPVVKAARLAESAQQAKDLLDSLAAGACDQAQFFSAVGELLRAAPDSGWELLGLVDQYYRRGKITSLVFGGIKARLQGLLVGKGESDEIINPPRMQGEPVPHPDEPNPEMHAAAARATGAPPAVAITLARRAQASRSAAAGNPANSAAPHTLEAGSLVRGRYLIQGLLGRGGMGVVYAAIDQYRLDQAEDDQRVALKVLHTEVIKRPRLFAELRREFQHLQSLSHPNIVRVHEFDRDGDLAFFTMEFLSGALLSQVLPGPDSTALHTPYALAIIRDVGGAIAHAHARGVVHGDLNPGNIFITDNGDVRVLDFGASHPLHRVPWISEFTNPDRVAVATPGFASCQVLEGEAADARDDIYALASVAYVLLTGSHPYKDKTPLHARSLGLKPRRPRALNHRQWKALREALHFDRDRRPANVAAWLDRLDLRRAAAQLPPLLSIRTAPAHSRSMGRLWKQAAAALVCVACGWFAATHLNSMQSAGQWAQEQWKFAQTQLRDAPTWLTQHGLSPQTGAQTLTPGAHSVAAEPALAPTEPTRRAPADAITEESSTAPPSTQPVIARSSAPAAPPVAQPAAGSKAPAAAAADFPKARIELSTDTVEVAPADAMAQVIVRRSRNLHGDVSFSWWTESGTAKPATDFVQVKPQVATIANGQNAVSLVIPVVADPARRAPRSFYVVIDEPSDNATIGVRRLAMVTLVGLEPVPDTDAEQ